MKIARERREGSVVRKPFEQLTDVNDPEWALETNTNLTETFGKTQKFSLPDAELYWRPKAKNSPQALKLELVLKDLTARLKRLRKKFPCRMA